MSGATARQFADRSRHAFEDVGEWMAANCYATIGPAPREEWQTTRTPEDVIAAEHKLDSWLMKPTDGMWARMNRRISIPISRQLIKFPISPNVVTLLILGVSVASGTFFARGGYWNMLLGAFLSVWSSILDGCDGEVARLKLQSSELGCWLDTICDYLYYILVFVGITWGLKRTSGDIYLVWGVALVVGTLLSSSVVGWMRRRVAADHPEKFLARFHSEAEGRSSNPLMFLARNTEFIIRRCFFPNVLLVAALLNIIKPIFLMTAVGANLVWIIALYSAFALSGRKRNPQAVGSPIPASAHD